MLEKQSDHKSKTYNRCTKTRSKEHKHNTKENQPTAKWKRTRKKYKINGKSRFKMTINTCLSIITLNINNLNTPTKEWQTEQNKQPTICYLQETHLRAKDPHRSKVRGWKRYSMEMKMTRK